MPKYRVLEKSFIGNNILAEGDVVDYDGAPGKNLEPMDAPAQQAATEHAATLTVKDISVADMTRQKVAAIGGDPDAVDTARAATAAGAAAEAVLQDKPVLVDGKPLEAPAPAATGAAGLV